jgi:hypothetical protein
MCNVCVVWEEREGEQRFKKENAKAMQVERRRGKKEMQCSGYSLFVATLSLFTRYDNLS